MDYKKSDTLPQERQEQDKRERLLTISDTTYKILCLADSKGYDPSMGAEKLANMFVALSGPLDFSKLELERAKRKARQFNLL